MRCAIRWPKCRCACCARAFSALSEINALEQALDREAAEAAGRALEAPLPEISRISRHVYSEDLDPTSTAFATEQAASAGRSRRRQDPAAKRAKTPRTMADLINACLHDEMRRDPRIVVYGEDVADASREEALAEVKGKGGVFKLTAGLQTEFGSERVFNSPLAEANIVGRAVGYAVRGMKPVVEIQFFDYIWPAMHQIHNELALMRWRSNGAWAAPAVIRVPIGGYLDRRRHLSLAVGREHLHPHSRPARRLPVKRARCQRPLAHRDPLRRSGAFPRAQAPLPRDLRPRALSRPGFRDPLRQGKDRASRLAHLRSSPTARLCRAPCRPRERAQRDHGIEVEMIDLRTLSPYDWEAIATSVRKTSRVIVAHEDMLSWGYGAEIAARIADELFDDLDAPVRRIGSMDTFVAYQPVLEDAILPQPDSILKAIQSLRAY